MHSFTARIPPLCVVTRYGYGGTAGNQPEFPVVLRNVTLIVFIIGGGFNGHLVYFHLGAMQGDSQIPLCLVPGTPQEDSLIPFCGSHRHGDTAVIPRGTLWLPLCHPLLSCPWVLWASSAPSSMRNTITS